VTDRYQEHKYVLLASLYVCEILLVGILVMAAIQDNSVAQFIVLASIVFLNDIGVLCFIFIPKVHYVEKGIPEGLSVVQTIRKDDYYSGVAMSRLQHQQSWSSHKSQGENRQTKAVNQSKTSRSELNEHSGENDVDRLSFIEEIEDTQKTTCDVLPDRFGEISAGSVRSEIFG